MKVLMITGDKNFKAGNPRYDLQRSLVDELAVVYWGKDKLRPTIPAGRFDVVTAQDPFWRGLFAWRAARKLNTKLNIQVHADLVAQSFVKHVLAQVVLRHADSVRVVSEKIKKQVEHISVRGKITVLPVYIDVEKFRAMQPQPHSLKTILWIGRFEPEKDPLSALEVLKEVRKSVDAKLVMLGKGSLGNFLRAEISRFHLDGQVELAGWQDPVGYLAKADVVLCTSREESWGASILESLAAGVPVVAPDVGIAREAGAIITPRSDLGGAVVEVLKSGQKGELKLNLPSKEEWASEWKKSLL